MQEMLNTVYDYSSDNRFLIHPIKSITIVKVSTSEIQKEYKKQSKILLWEIFYLSMSVLTTRYINYIRPNKKICVVPVTLPTLIFSPYPKDLFTILQ
jgi:hypothetical protein